MLCGCASTDIRIKNRDAIAPTGRVVWQPIGPKPERDRAFKFSGLSLEADVSYAQGRAQDENGIQPTENIRIGANSVSGASPFNARAKVVDVKGTIRGGFEIGQIFRLEPMIGFEVIDVGLTITGSSGQFTQKKTAAGLLYGLRAGVQAHEMVEFYGRFMNGILDGRGQRVDSVYSYHAEAGVRLAPIDFVSIFAGYRWTEFDFQIDKEQTDPEISLDGAVIGMELRF